MIRGYTGLDGGKDEDLAIGGNFEDGAAAVSDIEIADLVEGESGGDTHALGVGG